MSALNFLRSFAKATLISAIVIMGAIGFTALGFFVVTSVAAAGGREAALIAGAALVAIIMGAHWAIAERLDQ